MDDLGDKLLGISHVCERMELQEPVETVVEILLTNPFTLFVSADIVDCSFVLATIPGGPRLGSWCRILEKFSHALFILLICQHLVGCCVQIYHCVLQVKQPICFQYSPAMGSMYVSTVPVAVWQFRHWKQPSITSALVFVL